MTLAFQFNDIREAVYEWLSEEIRWTPGDTRLGDVLNAKFRLRIQTLKKMLSDEKQFEPARDVRQDWEAAVSQLNDDTLYDYLNTTYADKLVSPDYVCDDRWPETGPDRVYDFLHSLGGFHLQFQPQNSEVQASNGTEQDDTPEIASDIVEFASAEAAVPPEFPFGPLVSSAAAFARILSDGHQDSKEWLQRRHEWKWYFVRKLGERTVEMHFKTESEMGKATSAVRPKTNIKTR